MSSGVDEQTPNLLLDQTGDLGSVDTWGGKLNETERIDEYPSSTEAHRRRQTGARPARCRSRRASGRRAEAHRARFSRSSTRTPSWCDPLDPHTLCRRIWVKELINIVFPIGTIMIWGSRPGRPSRPAGPCATARSLNNAGAGRRTCSIASSWRRGAASGRAMPVATAPSTTPERSGTALSVEQMPQHTHGIVDNGHAIAARSVAQSRLHAPHRPQVARLSGWRILHQRALAERRHGQQPGRRARRQPSIGTGTGVYADYRGASWGHDHSFGISAAWYQFYPPFYSVCYIMKVQWF